MRRWMKVVFCFLFGIIFTNMFTMDQAVADESFGKREISAESSVLTQKKQAVLDMETMTFSLESEADEEEDVLSNHVYLYDRVSGKLRVGSSVQTGRMMA